MGRAEARRVDESQLTMPMPRLQTGGAEAAVSEAAGGGVAKGATSEWRGGAPDDAVAMPAAQTRLCKAKGGASEKAGALAPLRIKASKTHASATRPRLRTGLGDGEPESRRPQARNAGKRQKRTWHALQQADVEVHLIPLDGLKTERGDGAQCRAAARVGGAACARRSSAPRPRCE